VQNFMLVSLVPVLPHLCASEDCIVLHSIRNITAAPAQAAGQYTSGTVQHAGF